MPAHIAATMSANSLNIDMFSKRKILVTRVSRIIRTTVYSDVDELAVTNNMRTSTRPRITTEASKRFHFQCSPAKCSRTPMSRSLYNISSRKAKAKTPSTQFQPGQSLLTSVLTPIRPIFKMISAITPVSSQLTLSASLRKRRSPCIDRKAGFSCSLLHMSVSAVLAMRTERILTATSTFSGPTYFSKSFLVMRSMKAFPPICS
mmetsp:Transcript_125907/g.235432  ORF Transcript_125907/g.235432 Transcript_125907/m.235432 type:complete len:204 (-) Transcript_125907:348-959(-)